jgi:hypothetical protein
MLSLRFTEELLDYLKAQEIFHLYFINKATRNCLASIMTRDDQYKVRYLNPVVPDHKPLDEFELVDFLILPDGSQYEVNGLHKPESNLFYLVFHPVKRWCLITNTVIRKGSTILPYVGELIRTSEAYRRQTEIYDPKVQRSFVPSSRLDIFITYTMC